MKYIMILVCLFIFAGCSNQQDQGTIKTYNGEVIREDPRTSIVVNGKEYGMRGKVGDFTISDTDFVAGKKQTYTFYIWFGNKEVDKQSLNQNKVSEWNQLAGKEKDEAIGKKVNFTAIEGETLTKQNISNGVIQPLNEKEEEEFPLGTTVAKVVTTASLPSKGVWRLEGDMDGQNIGNVTITVKEN